MSCPFSEEQLGQLKAFIDLCKSQPQILLHPKLSFFKDYLVGLGVTLPTATFGTKNFTAPKDNEGNNNVEEPRNMSSDDESEPESQVELDMDGVIEGDIIDSSQEMGDETKEVTDEERDQSDEKRSEAMKAFSEQQFDEAIKFYTEAIKLNPQSALLFAKRGQVYLKLNKPNACIKDCIRALELNCDSAAAYKFRGRANRLLGKFEEASHDLCESLKIDYDDQTNEWLTEVKPNAEKLRQHKLSTQRKAEEKEHREKIKRLRRAQEARANAARAAAAGGAGSFPAGGFPAGGFPGGFPAGFPAGGFPGAGANFPGAGAGFSPADLQNLLSDNKIFDAFKDPEVVAAFQDMSTNPANFVKYQNNPKIAKVIEKLQNKFGGGKMPNFGGDGTEPNSKGSTDDDVGLD